MMQKRIGPATRSDPFGSRRRFPTSVPTVDQPPKPPVAQKEKPAAADEATQPEG